MIYCLALIFLLSLTHREAFGEDEDEATATRLPPHVVARKVPQLFRSDPFFYINKLGNCPGNFLPSIADEGISVNGLETCLKRCSLLKDCKSVAVRMRDLPYLLETGVQSEDNVTRCWLKTLDTCPKDFVPVGKNIEATMLVKYAQKPLQADLTAKQSNPWQNSTANCTVDGLPPPIPSTISIEISSEDSDSAPIWLGPLNVTRINATAFTAMAVVPGIPRGATRRLFCFAVNPGGASVRRSIEVAPFSLLKFASAKILFDEATNTSARIRWSRWNESVDSGEPPVVGYKVFVEPLGPDQLVVSQPSSFASEELVNSTFQALIDDRSCGNKASCQFRLLDLEPESRYLIGVMAVRPGRGGDNGTISWSPSPLATLCGRPSPIETLTGSIKWRRGMPQIILSFEAPRRAANCPEPGEFLVSYYGESERQFKVAGVKRQAEINDIRSEMNYTITAWYRNTEMEEGDPLRMSIWTGIPIKTGVKSTSSHSVTLEWTVAPSPSDFPTTFRIAYWQDSAKMTQADLEEGTVSASLMKFVPIDTNQSWRRGATSMECWKSVGDLRPNSLYYFAVLAINSASDEMYRSETLTVTTSCDVSQPPTNVTMARQTKIAIAIQWEIDVLPCPVDVIQLEFSAESLPHRVVLNVTNPAARIFEISTIELATLLPESTNVQVRVRFANVRGLWSDWSEPCKVFIPTSTIGPELPITMTSPEETTIPASSWKPSLSTYEVWSRITANQPNTSIIPPVAEKDLEPDSDGTSFQTMIIGILVGCGCVAITIAALCILLFKKKKLFSRNKVSRFSNSPSSGTSNSEGAAVPIGCKDFFVKANGAALTSPPRCLPDVAYCPNQQQQQQNDASQSPPTGSAPMTPPSPNRQEEPTSSSSLHSSQAGHMTSGSNHAWPSPALASAGSAINPAISTAIRIDRLKEAIMERKNEDLTLFRKEFASLTRKPDKPQEIGKAKINSVRNRYKDIFPYDFNCVLLDDEANVKEPIYVNASYIKGASGEREYVASQGPCSATVGEFWKMIWQLNISRVVMLTNAHEKGKVKCYKYWPDIQEASTFDGISVETLNEARFACYVRRTLRIRMRPHGERTETCSRVITQFQFTNWPDHRVVRFATPVVTFLRKLNKHLNRLQSEDKPLVSTSRPLILVHCSAGIGRTGTLIAADIAIKKSEQSLAKHSPHDVEVDIRNIVNTLREQRNKMVQNLEQYMFVYDLVYEALSSCLVKPTAMPLSMGPPVTVERLQREFDVLERTKPSIARQEFELAMDLKNAGKNRIQRILPATFCRVQMLTPSDDKQDYISAIWVDGYERTRSLIAAESPMPHTVADFWSVVWDWNVAAVVSLDPQPCLDPTYCPIGPSEEAEAIYHGAFKIKSLRRTAVSSRSNEETSRPYVVDVLSLTNSQKKADAGREVRHFGYTGAWLPNVRGIPASVEQFAEFVIGIDEARRAAQGRPVVVHCLDAATRTGLTLLSILLKEQCDCDDEVDIFTVLRTIRNFRPEFIPNFEQYSFAYNFVAHVLGSECLS